MSDFGDQSSKGRRKQQKRGFFARLFLSKSDGRDGESNWDLMTKEQQKKRIDFLWAKAKKYINKLRLQARLQKMAEQNLREMMIEDIQDDDDDESEIVDSQ